MARAQSLRTSSSPSPPTTLRSISAAVAVPTTVVAAPAIAVVVAAPTVAAAADEVATSSPVPPADTTNGVDDDDDDDDAADDDDDSDDDDDDGFKPSVSIDLDRDEDKVPRGRLEVDMRRTIQGGQSTHSSVYPARLFDDIGPVDAPIVVKMWTVPKNDKERIKEFKKFVDNEIKILKDLSRSCSDVVVPVHQYEVTQYVAQTETYKVGGRAAVVFRGLVSSSITFCL